MASESVLTRQLQRLSRHTIWAQTSFGIWVLVVCVLLSTGAGGVGLYRFSQVGAANTSLDWLEIGRERLELLRSIEAMQQDLRSDKSVSDTVNAFHERSDRLTQRLQALRGRSGDVDRAVVSTLSVLDAAPVAEPSTELGVHLSTVLMSSQIGALSHESPLVGDLAFPDSLLSELSRLHAVSGIVSTMQSASGVPDASRLLGAMNAAAFIPNDDALGASFDLDEVPAEFRRDIEDWLASPESVTLAAGVGPLLQDQTVASVSAASLHEFHNALVRALSTLTGIAQSSTASLAEGINNTIEATRSSTSRWLYAAIGFALCATVVLTLRQNRVRQADLDLRVAASTDGLTGLSNRAHLEDYVAELNDSNAELVLMHVDLDHFKPVNDTYGHAVGDRVLQLAAERLRAVADENNGLAARLGGDEFVVVIPDLGASDVDRVAHRLVDSLLRYSIGGLDISVGASIGVARGNSELHELLIDADLALYQAKRTGRGQAATFQSDAADFVEFVRSEVTEGRVQAVFQPQISLRDGRCVGAEVYARLVDRNGMLLQADEWLGVVEWMGWTSKLFEHLVTAVSDQITESGFVPPKLWINVAPADLVKPKGGEWVLEHLRRLNLDPERVGIELTNPEDVSDIGRLASVLGEIRAAGYGIALDDFGRKNAPLGYLRDLPITRIKLDKGLVSQVTPEMAPSAWIVRSLSDLARQLRIEVVAEGVSSGRQLEMLAKLGIPIAQGYLLGLPGGIDRIPLGMNLRQLAGVSLADLDRRAKGGLISPAGTQPGQPTNGNDRRSTIRDGDDRRGGVEVETRPNANLT